MAEDRVVIIDDPMPARIRMEDVNLLVNELREQDVRWRMATMGEQREYHDRRIAAEQKAEELLFRFLTDAQKQHFQIHGTIPVTGGTTGYVYFIERGYSQNIRVNATGPMMAANLGKCECDDCKRGRVRVVCCYMRIQAPHWDQMLAQMLFIQYAEEEFLKIAYVS